MIKYICYHNPGLPDCTARKDITLLMWLFFTLICALSWGAADLFYKKGAASAEPFTHLKTSVVVGVVMGAHAIITLVVSGMDYDFINLLVYLPVSLMYILSMTVGYLGLRYLELSVCSPVQNSSGAIVCILCLLFLGDTLDLLSASAVVLVCAGVFLLGFIEYRLNLRENSADGKPAADTGKYRKGLYAFSLPLIYCALDAAGTFLDAYYLDDFASSPLRGITEETLEDTANISYELTFLICAVLLFIYIRFIRRERFIPDRRTFASRGAAAVFETAGQYAYVYAMSGNAVIAAPAVASYCVISVLLSRIFLRERLNRWQYAAVALTVAGIALLGIAEGLAEV